MWCLNKRKRALAAGKGLTDMSVSHRFALALGISVALAVALSAQTGPSPAFIYSHQDTRMGYLANAVIWRDPGPLTPEQIKAGPPAAIPEAIKRGSAGEVIECRFERPGIELGGATEKFSCITADGKSVRIKYYDGHKGNREVFAEVVATRLMWALGFDADPMFSLTVNCLGCPEDPQSGQGARQTRRYPAAYEPHYIGTIITSSKDPDQGWRFGELERAVNSLPAGALRVRQHTYFDALTLLAVFMQHGDRKHSQQRLICRGEIDVSKGDMHDIQQSGESDSFKLPVLFENPNERACVGETVVTIQDVGATFGGAGMFTRRTAAKINLKEWAGNDIWNTKSSGKDSAAGQCIAHMTVSGSSGSEANENPRIGEAGRAFLLEQLKRLSPEHVKAIFEAAHVDQVGDSYQWTDRAGGKSYTGVDAWVAAFLDKVKQIESRSCSA
jgi:hypothetical protein